MTGAKIRGAIIVALAALFMTSCDSDGTSGLPQSFDRSDIVIEVTVIWHETQADIDKAYREEFGRDNIDRLGFAVWANPGRQPYWCRIHAQKPKRIDDEKMATLGHEMFHCLTGTFHQEP